MTLEEYKKEVNKNIKSLFEKANEEEKELLNTMVNVINDLSKEKQELIDYLNKKIKHIDDLINKSKPKPYGEELNLYENSRLRYLEILSKIEKSDK